MLALFSIFMILLFLVMFVLAFVKGKQFLHLPLKWRLGIVLPFAALMFIWIILLNREADRHELTIQHLCWDSAGHAFYPKRMELKSTACATPEPFVWKKTPKLVYLDLGPTKIYHEYKGSYKEALRLWNDQLGKTVFKDVDNRSEADIVVQFGPVGGEEAATTRHTRAADGSISAIIEVVRPMDIRQTYIHMAHELGHAGFGLAHDYHGIMHPAPSEGDGMKVWLVTEPDKRAINKMLYE